MKESDTSKKTALFFEKESQKNEKFNEIKGIKSCFAL